MRASWPDFCNPKEEHLEMGKSGSLVLQVWVWVAEEAYIVDSSFIPGGRSRNKYEATAESQGWDTLNQGR